MAANRKGILLIDADLALLVLVGRTQAKIVNGRVVGIAHMRGWTRKGKSVSRYIGGDMSVIRPLALISCLLLAISVGGCASACLMCRYGSISEQPIKGGVSETLPPQRSSIRPSIVIPYSALQRAANEATNNFQFSQNGREQIWHGKWTVGPITVFEGSIDADWSLNARRNGPIAVSGNGDALNASLPVAFDGKVGLAGDLARLLSLSGKNFDGAFHANIASRLGVDPSFAPVLQNPSVAIAWDSGARLEVIGRNCVGVSSVQVCAGPVNWDLTDRVSGPLTTAANSAFGGINLPASELRSALASIWRNYSMPISALPGEAHFLNIKPQSISLEDVLFENQGARLAGQVDALVSIDNEGVPQGSLGPLPPNAPTSGPAGDFRVSVPISVRYREIDGLVSKSLVGKEFDTATGAGRLRLWVKGIEVYPSGNRLVVGVKFAVKTPHSFLNTSGTIWLAGELAASSDGQQVLASNLDLTRKFSNPLWDVASVLLDNDVQNAVKAGATLDLRDELTDASTAVEKQIESLSNEAVIVDTNDTSIRLGKILTNNDALVVEGLLRASVEATLKSLPP